MKTKFVFDKESGTMVPESQIANQEPPQQIQEIENSVEPPKFEEEKQVEMNRKIPMAVKTKIVDYPTPLQLVNENGIPYAFIDMVDTGVTMFRDREDYDICQITDDRTGAVLAYIGGYALQINFNMAELRTLERVEQCLEGITKLFRHKILSQPLDRNV